MRVHRKLREAGVEAMLQVYEGQRTRSIARDDRRRKPARHSRRSLHSSTRIWRNSRNVQGERPMKTTATLACLLLAGVARPALATDCTIDALNALHVPRVTVVQASPIVAAGETPAHCDVHGTVITHGEGVPDGVATFAMQLPQAWQQRFFLMGIGGNGGPLIPAVNATDHASALGKGYAVIVTDTGHTGNGTDASWVLDAGRQARRQAKVIDFFYRAEHDVTVAGKQFAAGLLRHTRAARLFRRLLERRPHGDDGGRPLSRRLRRHHRRRSRHGLQLGDASLCGAEGGVVIG